MKKEIKEHLKKIKEKEGKEHIDCNFGMKVFNTKKRKLLPEEILTANAPTKSKDGNKPPKVRGGNTSSIEGIIYLDFTGHLVTGTSWNYAGDINCSPANLTAEQIDAILDNVIREYAPYNVIVTTNENLYNTAPINKKIRVIFTETWEWYGQAGGVAFINSFSDGSSNPCFIFTSLLNYSTKFIKEAASHEIGHTIGLYHQSKYDNNCVKISEYNIGDGIQAPIMGIGYYVSDEGSKWWVGPNSFGCNNIQDDNAILIQKLGLK